MVKRISESSVVLGALLRSGDKQALQKVSSALKKRQGNVRRTARDLGVPERSLWRWIGAIDDLEETLHEARIL